VPEAATFAWRWDAYEFETDARRPLVEAIGGFSGTPRLFDRGRVEAVINGALPARPPAQRGRPGPSHHLLNSWDLHDTVPPRARGQIAIRPEALLITICGPAAIACYGYLVVVRTEW
jgi:hypothetical protein